MKVYLKSPELRRHSIKELERQKLVEHLDLVNILLFAMLAVAEAIALLVAPLNIEREIIVCLIGAHGVSAVILKLSQLEVKWNLRTISRVLYTQVFKTVIEEPCIASR